MEAVSPSVNLVEAQRLLDLYCGTGTIGIYCSDGAKSVYGIELVESAVQDARVNAELNNVGNCTFMTSPESISNIAVSSPSLCCFL